MPAKLKIVHLITDLETGGAEKMLCKLVGRMDRSRFTNVVISMTDMGTLGGTLASMGVPVFALGMSRGRPDLWRAGHLVRLLRRERPDVLQTWLYHADLLGLVAGKVARVPSISWNIRCSDMDMSQYSPLSGLVLRALAKLSSQPDVVVVNSTSGRRLHESLGYRPRRWQFIPNGFDLDQFRPDPTARLPLRQELSLPPDAPLIGLIARYDPMKGQQTFIEAAGQAARRHRTVHFILAGRGVDAENRPLSMLIGDRDLRDRVHLLGERTDVPRIMAALDILSLASVSEGFPNTVGEGMAAGVPCVVTDVGDGATIVGDTGLVVPPRAPGAMADAWLKILGMSADERSALGQSARQRIAQNFSLESVARQYETLYTDLKDRASNAAIS